ncbi:MAG TPA: nucleoside hydrolase [Acidobacteriaceae bacterium]|nr:nucleoside hydrolase [Acidobacteriaceae bacterium]
MVILDTDIGDDIDDAFALALLLSGPDVDLLGVTTAWGDTDLRARLVARFLAETGHADVPVAAGPETKASSVFSQRRYAEGYPPRHWPNGVDFILDQIRRHPGQITLVAIAPFSTVVAAIDRDPETFRKLKRVVLMGGSIHRHYGDMGYLPDRGPEPEYNIDSDIASSRKLFASGVPIYMMPLDSTQLKLDEVLRAVLFSQGTRTTNALSQLYWQWSDSTGSPTPTLFDAMAAAYVLDPSLCPTTPMHIRIDDRGNTLPEPGPANANVCLQSDSDRFFHFYLRTVLGTSR